MSAISSHIPVMLPEVLSALNPKSGQVIVDCTFGRGGYSSEFLKQDGTIIYAIDRDPIAISTAKKLKSKFPKRFFIIEGLFSQLKNLLASEGISCVDAIILDLGLSSPQINDGDRGFSFKLNGPLNMQMGTGALIAKDIVNLKSHGELAYIIKKYGEEKMAGKIASAILRARNLKPIETTSQLADIVRTVVYSKKSKIDPATRTFQAIRIAVNDELSEIEKVLNQSIDLLSHNGKLIVVSFHSLEDRIVKQFIKRNCISQQTNRHLPQDNIAPPLFKEIVKGALKCSKAEATLNPRSRSAKMRACIRQHHNH